MKLQQKAVKEYYVDGPFGIIGSLTPPPPPHTASPNIQQLVFIKATPATKKEKVL